MTNHLNELRKEVEKLDKEIIDILARRFHLTGEIGKIKEEKGMAVEDEEREEELLAIYEDLSLQKGLEPDVVKRIFEKLFEESRADQQGA